MKFFAWIASFFTDPTGDLTPPANRAERRARTAIARKTRAKR